MLSVLSYTSNRQLPPVCGMHTTRGQSPPRMDMLSVLSTPCVKPTLCHAATSFAVRSMTSPSSSRYLSSLPAANRHQPTIFNSHTWLRAPHKTGV